MHDFRILALGSLIVVSARELASNLLVMTNKLCNLVSSFELVGGVLVDPPTGLY
jgi:hypothetical protein